MKKLALILAGGLLLTGAAALLLQGPSGDAVPRVSLTDLAQLPVKIPAPYNESADATTAVDAAMARAKQSGKRVMIVLGGNWCADCIVLANVAALPDVKPFLDSYFERVSVDLGRFDRNLHIPARFGITERLRGVPTVLIATADGKLVNPGDPFTLANSTQMTPQSIVDWLAQWTK
jgi:hypothetical protein